MCSSVIHIETLGCKLNQLESESIASRFADEGFAIDMKPLAAAQAKNRSVLFSILNTCTVTGKAEQKARRIIRLLQTSFPQTAVLVTGCYAELDRDIIASLGKNVIVVPGSMKQDVALLAHYLKQKGVSDKSDPEKVCTLLKNWQPPKYAIADETKNRFILSTDSFAAHSRASLKIQDGCSGSCSYCRVRLARGMPVSLDAHAVLERVRRLEAAGQSEIVLTGVNLSLYKSVFSDGTLFDFAALLDFLLKNTSVVSFRLSSLHPEYISEHLCSVLTHNRIRPHFHLSVQSGSNRILQTMNRPYTRETVITAVQKLRSAKNNPFFACDIITGFPGETDEDFNDTISLCTECGFAGIHAFPFSPRPGTAAFSMNMSVPQHIAGQRVNALAALAAKSKKNYIQYWTGKILSGIIEKGRINSVRAVTENYLHVELENCTPEQAKPLGGKEVPLRILAIRTLAGRAEETEASAELA